MNLQHKITELKEKKKIFSLLLMGISRQRWRKGYVRTYRLAEKKKNSYWLIRKTVENLVTKVKFPSKKLQHVTLVPCPWSLFSLSLVFTYFLFSSTNLRNVDPFKNVDPIGLFLSEPKASDDAVKRVIKKIGFSCFY